MGKKIWIEVQVLVATSPTISCCRRIFAFSFFNLATSSSNSYVCACSIYAYRYHPINNFSRSQNFNWIGCIYIYRERETCFLSLDRAADSLFLIMRLKRPSADWSSSVSAGLLFVNECEVPHQVLFVNECQVPHGGGLREEDIIEGFSTKAWRLCCFDFDFLGLMFRDSSLELKFKVVAGGGGGWDLEEWGPPRRPVEGGVQVVVAGWLWRWSGGGGGWGDKKSWRWKAEVGRWREEMRSMSFQISSMDLLVPVVGGVLEGGRGDEHVDA